MGAEQTVIAGDKVKLNTKRERQETVETNQGITNTEAKTQTSELNCRNRREPTKYYRIEARRPMDVKKNSYYRVKPEHE